MTGSDRDGIWKQTRMAACPSTGRLAQGSCTLGLLLYKRCKRISACMRILEASHMGR